MMEEVEVDNPRQQSKKIKQNLKASENFKFLVSPIFDHYYKSFTSLSFKGNRAPSPPSFKLFLIIPNFLRFKINFQ